MQCGMYLMRWLTCLSTDGLHYTCHCSTDSHAEAVLKQLKLC